MAGLVRSGVWLERPLGHHPWERLTAIEGTKLSLRGLGPTHTKYPTMFFRHSVSPARMAWLRRSPEGAAGTWVFNALNC